MQISFLALAIGSKKSQTISETHAKWSRFGAVSETWGLASLFMARIALPRWVWHNPLKSIPV